MPCTDPMQRMLEPFRPLFTALTWKKMLTLLRGTLLARGRRTVTLWQTGHQQDAHFSSFHQVLNRARWSPLQASRQLLTLIIDTFVQAGGSVDMVIDETLERRWGTKIRKRGHYRDSARSSRQRSVSSPGLRWIVLAMVVQVPWTRQRWALPDLPVLATTPEVSQQLGLRHKTLGMRAHQLVSLLQRWLPGVPITLLGDLAYSILELGLQCAKHQITLIAPFRLDSVMHQPPPMRTKHTLGRPPVVGKRLPSLEHILQDSQTVWQRLTLDWYGQGARTLEFCSGTGGTVPLWIDALTHSVGAYSRPSRKTTAESLVFYRPSPSRRGDHPQLHEALDVGSHPSRESRAYLGIETQRQWSDLAIERTTPRLFGLYSLVTLFGHALAPQDRPSFKQAAWYRKQAATFSDVLALVRRHLWGNFTFPTSHTDPDVVLIPRSVLVQLAHAVCY